MAQPRRGLLIILSSPSGAGKSTLAKRLIKWDPSLTFSVSATTRAPRVGEVDGQDYHFMSDAAFKTTVAEGAMLEHAHVFGNFYGSPMAPVAAAIDSGCDVLFDIDWQGAQQIRNSSLGKHTLSIFILPPSIPELRRRLVSRGQDTPETIGRRMQKSWDEISHWDGYDYVLVNEDLD
ncbi:MAG: guanylate kinase, partial [Paracoccaceae bacterium]